MTAARPRPLAQLESLLLGALLAGSCHAELSGERPPPTRAPAAAAAAPPAAEGAAAEGSSEQSDEPRAAGGAHDPELAPIDCPLRQQGIDPTQLRPFEDVESYIAFLDRADRATWQKPDAVIEALDLEGTETVVDLGAGSGYFTFRIADALPEGRVIALETEAEMVRHIHHKATAAEAQNIRAVLIEPTDPSVPADADLVFVCDVLHHVQGRQAWLRTVASSMPSGARLALMEFKEGDLPEGPPESVKIPRDQLVDMVTDVGLVLASERVDLLPYQTFLVFHKP